MGWTEVPDRVGVVVACRAWRWIPPRQAPGGPLRSVAKGTAWPALRRLEAECIEPQVWTWGGAGIRRPPPSHPAPHVDCNCGIWGLCSPVELLRQHASPAYVYGAVALWGAVVGGEQGWRGQFAYPQALVAVEMAPRGVGWARARGASYAVEPPSASVLAELAAAYRVPVLEEWPPLTPALGGG